MKIGLVTDCFGSKSFEELLKTCQALGIEQLELGCGNWSSAPHIDLDGLLESREKRDEMTGMLRDYHISISALNCSGNPLAPGDRGFHDDGITRKTFRLSKHLGLDTVVMMSGLPAGGPNDSCPNWVVTSWPPETQTMLDYQWNKAVPFWKELVKEARACGIVRIALEPHGCQLVHDAENFFRLRDALGGDECMGFNLDPSHLFWMGADPLAVIRALGTLIYHVHVKDVRIEKPAEVNTLLDGKHVLEFAKRSWNFAIPGFGHDEYWWRTFVVNLKMAGYDGVLSIEHEDHTMDVLDGVSKTAAMLNVLTR